MSLALTSSYSAIAVGLSVQLLATGGTAPYTYSVNGGGAGGTINSATGLYTAPATTNSANPSQLYDTITVTDNVDATATFQILIGTPLLLLANILQSEMGLDNQHIYLWDQKIMQPTDSSLYLAISVPSCRPFANTIEPDPTLGWSNPIQRVNMQALVTVDAISRGPEARDRKEEIVLALNSIYAQSQQEINSFYIGKLPPGSDFKNLSMIDGAAIPYRYQISFMMQYFVSKTKAVPYFNTFQAPSVATNP